jgi:hypothetical protein
LNWQVGAAGRLRLFDVLAIVFVLAFAVERLLDRDRVVARPEVIVGIFVREEVRGEMGTSTARPNARAERERRTGRDRREACSPPDPG